MVFQAPPPDDYEGEIEFEAKAWASARQQFLEGRRGKKHADTEEALQDFLSQSCSAESARKYVKDAQKEKPQYAAGLGVIMTKMDAFMKVGDLAIKSAPESIGLAWAGIRLCLHSVQNDFATFSQYNDACSDMIGILINCSVYADMFGRPHAAKKMKEIHGQVLDRIPKIYAGLLDFNYSMRKHTNTNRGTTKYKDKFAGLKTTEQEMRDFANTASQQLSQYYQEINMQNEVEILNKQKEFLGTLGSMDEAIRDANRIMEEGFRRQEESLKLLAESSRRQEEDLKDLKKQSPFEQAKQLFEQNKQKLDPSIDFQVTALKETLNREPGTCQWIFDEPEYKDWYSSATNSMLWISAAGGFGKSFLMGSIIEALQEKELQDEGINISYFFCKRGNDQTQKTEKIKNSIIFQLYREAKDNPDTLFDANKIVSSLDLSKSNKSAGAKAKSETKKTATFAEAYQGLVRLLKKEVFLVIDALDEIGDRGDQPFFEDFRSIVEAPDIKVHILFGSRPEGDLKKQLDGVTAFDVKGRNQADIRLNVTTLVGKLSGFSASERQLAIEDIVVKSGGQFRYVKPAIDFLALPWSRPLENRLKKLQEGLTNSYTQALQLTDPNYQDLLKACLTWALLGEGQVKVAEVMDAFSCTYSQGHDDEDVEDIANDEQPLKQVEKAGTTFLDVDWKTGVIAPRHETVTEYFLNHHDGDAVSIETPAGICPICKEKSHSEQAQQRPFIITKKDGHLEIAIAILEALTSPAFWRKHYPDEYWQRYFADFWEKLNNKEEVVLEIGNEVDKSSITNGDLADATDGVDTKNHAKDLENTTDLPSGDFSPITKPGGVEGEVVPGQPTETKDAETATIPENSEIPDISVTEAADGTVDPVEPEETKNPDDTLDAPDIPDDISATDSDIHPEEETYDISWQPPDIGEMRYEVSHCAYHLEKVEELWKPEERTGPTFDRLRDLMKSLFDPKSENWKKWLEIQTRIQSSPLCWEDSATIHPIIVAAAYRLTDLMKLLVNSDGDAKPNITDLNLALYFASSGTMEKSIIPVFEILLENGADPTNTLRSTSPFNLSLMLCHRYELIKLFLDHGADAKKMPEWLWTPLHYLAVEAKDDGDDLKILDLLLESGCDINAQDDEGEAPLHYLVRRRDCPPEFLRAYIAKGANVNEDDKEEQRPLYEVCNEGNVEIARIILEFNPDIEKADKKGVTALLAASTNGHPKTIELLIQHGANITALDKRNRGCFFLACGSDSAEAALYIASQLKGENEKLLSLKSDAGKSPLTKAAGKGHTEVVKMLLEKIDSASVNEQDTKYGLTPLHVAAMNGSKNIVELLLKHGASTTITDKKGNTAFRECCRTWAQSPSKDAGALLLLMEREPNESLQDYELLNSAAVKGNVPVLEKLFEKGVSLIKQDKHGWTPLQIASQYENTEAMDFLAKQGAIIGRKPTVWACDSDMVLLSEEEQVVKWIAGNPMITGRIGVMSNHPIPAGVKRYYYEISITEPEGKNTNPLCGLGLANAPAKNTGWMPGWGNKTSGGAPSWGYHGDDGDIYTDKKRSRIPELDFRFPLYGHGDTVGCAVDFDKGEMFFTKNGEKLDTAFSGVKGRLHPVVGMGQEVTVRGNWGLDIKESPFRWANANVVGGGWVD
ncbi:hypothetical protein G7Y89_g14219 [Cudoniella acicularis]|uniref:B30.2/SPRY domain-containing protein n=1 Tax=Cudoniella acicularis TaxID=354080 RepID=A0A8H4R5Z1_9HELO|nr:hypothetical protein G7Y89_g14219 [Cudoniella acicularis]